MKEKKYYMEGDGIYQSPENQNEERYYVGVGKILYVFFVNENTHEMLYAQYPLADSDFMKYGGFTERDLLRSADSAARDLLKPYIILDEKANGHGLRIIGTLDNGKTLLFTKLERETEPLPEMGEGAFLMKDATFFRMEAGDFEELVAHGEEFAEAVGGETLETAAFVKIEHGEVVAY